MRFRTNLVFVVSAAAMIVGLTCVFAGQADRAGMQEILSAPLSQTDRDLKLLGWFDRQYEQGATLSEADKELHFQFESRYGAVRGRDVLDNRGGPDAFHYVFMDNVPPDTVSYAWIELRGDPSATWLRGLTDFTSITDGYSRQKLPIGFSFPFYGATYDCVRVATNGFLQFTTTSTWLDNACLPSTLVAGPMIAVFWDDLHLLRGGRTDTVVVGYRSFGDGFVVEFDQIGFYSTSCPNVPLKFEAILYPNGNIKLQYATVTPPLVCANSQSIGIQQAGAAGSAALNYVCNATGIQPADGRAILFSRAGGVPNPVTNLTGQYVAPNVVLNWNDPTQDTYGNPITIDSVQVWVGAVGSGTLLATVARGVQSCAEASPLNGPRLYYVRAHCNPYYGVAASCSVMVGNPSYFNDFEADNGGWVPDPAFGGWEWGRPTLPVDLTAHSGTKVWGTVLDANYPGDACWTLTLSPGLIVRSPTATVEFWCWWDMVYSYDGVNFKVSTDQGATWTLVQPNGGYPSASSIACIASGCWLGYTGSGTWTHVILPIGQFLGQTPIFRLTFGSDNYQQYPGFFFDDMFISGLRAPSSVGGTVRAFFPNQPIVNARVWAEGVADTAVTDSAGAYRLRLDAGTYTLWFRHIHFCDTSFGHVVVVAGSQTACDAVMRAPHGQVSMTSLSLETTVGVNVVDSFQITNIGGQCPLSFTTSDTSAWLSLDPVSGSVAPNQSVTITVHATVAGMEQGDYVSAVFVTYNSTGSPADIRIDLHIEPSAVGLGLLLPTAFAYYQNCPNPFNAQTSLRFDVPQQSRVQITIYNIMGQEVVRPVDDIYLPGRYRVLFDAGRLPSGMYLVKMTAADFTQIGKMMLLK